MFHCCYFSPLSYLTSPLRLPSRDVLRQRGAAGVRGLPSHCKASSSRDARFTIPLIGFGQFFSPSSVTLLMGFTPREPKQRTAG